MLGRLDEKFLPRQGINLLLQPLHRLFQVLAEAPEKFLVQENPPGLHAGQGAHQRQFQPGIELPETFLFQFALQAGARA